MTNVKDMISAIENENFDTARNLLKVTLADYISGKKYVSNSDIFGDDYVNPNKEEQELKKSVEG